MHAEIVMIGTELLLGELVDTNALIRRQKLTPSLRPLKPKCGSGSGSLFTAWKKKPCRM